MFCVRKECCPEEEYFTSRTKSVSGEVTEAQLNIQKHENKKTERNIMTATEISKNQVTNQPFAFESAQLSLITAVTTEEKLVLCAMRE